MKNRVIRILCTSIAAAFLICSTALANEDFVRIQGSKFTYKGDPVRMKGTNYYPRDGMWAAIWTNWDWNAMVRDAGMIRDLGMNSVRILVPYSHGGWNGPNVPADRLQKLEDLVNMLGQNGIRSCITLFDWETSFPAAGTQKESEHIYYLNLIVNRLKDNKYVFMWDVKNEPDHPSNISGHDAWDNSPADRDKIVSWLNRMCIAVKARDVNHPVGCGLRWYQNVKDVISFSDIAIFHSYWWTIVNTEITTIKNAMGANQKPILAQEFGWPSNPYPCNRDGRLIYDYNETEQLNFYTQELTAFEQHDIAGCIQWMTFDAKRYTTNEYESFENYFGLWRYDYSLKPAGEFYRDNFVTQPFPYIDVTPPGLVTGFKAEPKDGSLNLSWNNPLDGDFEGALIRFSTTGFPNSITDGQLLVDYVAAPGSVGSYVHDGLTNGVTYYYSAFSRDKSGNYSAAANASGTPFVPPVVSLLANGTIDAVTGGVAGAWTSYRVTDNNALQFNGDTGYFDSMPVSQGIASIDSWSLPSSGYSAGGIYQVVPNVTPGKTYMLVGLQDFYCGTWSAAGQRYLHNFGINTTGGTNPGSAGASGTIGGAKWMGSGFQFWNNSSGGAQVIGGFHRVSAAHTAENSSISIWSGLNINNAAARDAQPAKFNTDSMYLYEFDNSINYTNQLINPGFEQRFDLQNGNDIIPIGWTPAGGSIGQYSKWSVEAGGRNGTYGARVFHRRGHMNMGFMQRISTLPGTAVSFSAWVICNNIDDNMNAFIGIDPTGGTDITSTFIVWTSTRSTAWTLLTVNTTAAAGSATLYVRGSTAGGGTGGYHTATFDDVSAVWTPSDNIPPTNPPYAADLNGAVNGSWTDKNSPEFVFGGASDTGGSGVAGYDVYWGTSSSGTSITASVTNPSYKPAALPSSGTYYLRVRTKDAAGNLAGWTTLFIYKYDATAPSAPGTVNLSSAYIVDGRTNANWGASTDNESGISDYFYAVGTTAGGTDISGWIAVGNVTSKQIEDISAAPGVICYISIKARNAAGTDSSVSTSQAVTTAALDATIGGAKKHPDNQAAALTGKVVSAVFAGRFYIQEPDRSGGIAVISEQAPLIGSVVDVTGILSTTSDGEKCLVSPEVSTVQGTSSAAPTFMTIRSLGGSGFHYNEIDGSGQCGTKAWMWRKDNSHPASHEFMDVPGLNNIGMLVKTAGKITKVDTDTFYLDDGSGHDDGDPLFPGVCVTKPAGASIAVGDFVTVTGISSCIKRDGNVYRLIRTVDVR